MMLAMLQQRLPQGSHWLGNPSPTPTYPSKFSIIQRSWSAGPPQVRVEILYIKLMLALDRKYISGKNLCLENSFLRLTFNVTCLSLYFTFPALRDLQGSVEDYILTALSTQHRQTLTLDPTVTSVVLSDLQPSTEYKLSLTVSNGAHNITSPEVSCTTTDGGEYMPHRRVMHTSKLTAKPQGPRFVVYC